MATTEEERQRPKPISSMVNQIPGQSFTAPPPSGISNGTEFTRNAGNTLQALAPLGGGMVARGLLLAGRVASAAAATPTAAAVAPFVPVVAGGAALQSAASPPAPTAAPVPAPAVARPAVQPDSIRSRGQQIPTAPPTATVPPPPGAGSAVPGAPGAYRSTAPDGRVLYSDQPGAVSSAAALPSAQNSAAATALSDRSRVESLVATYGLDKARALLNGQPAPEATDPRALLLGQMKAAVDRNAPLTRSGAAVLTSLAASDAQAATSRGQQDTERRRVKVAEDEARIRNTAAITKMAAEQRYAAALAKGDEKEIKAAEDNLRAVQGKWEKTAPPTRLLVVPGGQAVIDGQTVTQPSMVFDPDTGKYILPQAAQKAPYPDNTRLTGKDGKSYVVKNGVPVKE